MSGLLDRRALNRILQVAFERDASFITDSDSTFTAASDQLEEILIDGRFGFSEECISLRNLLNNEQVASEALADPGVTDASEDVPQPAQVTAESRVTMNPV